jgi:hypothetical protein
MSGTSVPRARWPELVYDGRATARRQFVTKQVQFRRGKPVVFPFSVYDRPTQAASEYQEPTMGLFEAVAIGTLFAAGHLVAVLLLAGAAET